MEADWEVEIGPGVAVIEVFWAGFVDLVRERDRVEEIEEARSFPALSGALVRINQSLAEINGTLEPEMDGGRAGAVFTSKCDFWKLTDCDPDEMDASPSDAATGVACYIDLLPRGESVFESLEAAEGWSKAVIGRLKNLPRRNCRIDLMIRQAFAETVEGLGVTAYLSACGVDPVAAEAVLSLALEDFAEAVSFHPARG